MTNHSGIGVNGSKHICGGAEDEEARRDRQLSGTSVKSPKPYLMPYQLNLTMAIAGAVGIILAMVLL
jgi:hypothetical protein